MANKKLLAFRFHAVTESGKIKKGRLKAPTKDDAVEVLRIEGLVPISVDEQRGALDIEIFKARDEWDLKFKIGQKAAFARQLYLLVRAGLQMSRVLQVLGEDNPEPRYTRMCNDLASQVTAGVSLSRAMESYPRCFDDVFRAYVRSGEQTGDLEQALEMLAAQLESQNELRLKVKAVTAYPKMMGGAISLIVVAILMFLVPVYEDIYDTYGAELPGPTQFVMGLSSAFAPFHVEFSARPPFLTDVKPEGHSIFTAPINLISPVLWSLVAAFGWFRFRKKTKDNLKIGRRIDRVKYKVPVLGKLAKAVMLHRWTSTLSGALESGLATFDALEIASDASNSPWMKSVTIELKEAVRQGKPLSRAMKEHPALFDPKMRAMCASGEEAGEVAEMFAASARTVEHEVSSMVATLGARLEVGLLILMGVVVGGLLVVLYLPIFGLATTVGESYAE